MPIARNLRAALIAGQGLKKVLTGPGMHDIEFGMNYDSII
jgi:hypothetical protein